MNSEISRRKALLLTGTLGSSVLAGRAFGAPSPTTVEAGPDRSHGSETIAMVLYPGLTSLDLVGPLFAFSMMMGARIYLVAARIAPVPTDGPLTLMPTHTYDQVPADVDMVFVPGAPPEGTVGAMRDHGLLAFLADRGKRAKYVTSVCTGSLVLGVAGLLRGYRATSLWLLRDAVLPLVGATPVNARYVKDHNRITGAGVTSGIDFGLRIVAELRGESTARMVELMGEYDPQPPYRSGSPQTALPQTVAEVRKMGDSFVSDTARAARENTFRS